LSKLSKPKDHKEKPLTKKQLEIANVLRYMDERMISLVEQIRAVAIAGKVSPEDFQKAFVDQKAQDEFYVKLHVAEDNYELQEKAKIAREGAELGEPPTPSPTGAPELGSFAPPSLPEPEVLQGQQGEPPVQIVGD